MALAIPADRGQTRERNFSGRPSTTWGTTITASATPHALTGTETQIIAATTYEAEWIRIAFNNTAIGATNTDSLFNLYIGAGGSEVLFIDSLLAGWSAGADGGNPNRSYWFPVRIPRGTRLSGELRALIASDTVNVLIELGVSNGRHWVGSGVETLGEDTAASEGTDVTPGGASEGSYVTIGTTGRRYRYITPGVMGNNDTTIVTGHVAWDIGVGSAAYQGLDDWLTHDDGAEIQAANWDMGWWCDIPSGTALQMRGQHAGTPSGLQTCALYGVY